jgi:DNA-directed RNA polymerase sigma subunit (sigma70/sigma32)
MLSPNEAVVFDFPDQDPQVRLQNRPNLVLIYDSEKDEVLDVIDINELPDVPEESENTLDINHQQLGSLDAYRLYSFRLDQYPRLSAEQEQILTKQLATEDEAKKLMLLHNQPLVIALAKRYSNRRLELMDHIQTGLIGLDKATKKFKATDSRRNFKLL